MISLIQGQVVTQYHWMTMQEFTDVVAISQMTPGPIGINTATYCGYTAVHNAGMSGMMAVLGSAMATFALVLPSLVFDDSYQQDAVQVYEHHSRPEHLHRSSPSHRRSGRSRSPAPDKWRELLYASQSLAFLHLHRPLLCHLYRREGDEDQSYPHDTLLGFCRTGITILKPILFTNNKQKVDFHQKIHLLHYNSLFVHLFFVFFVYFCNCVLIAA